MLLLGRQTRRNCQSLTRRSFLQIGASTVLGLSLADLLRLRAHGTPVEGRARSVILLWLWGGPAQLDTWDPKPSAPLDYRGPFAAIQTRVPAPQLPAYLTPERLADRERLVGALDAAQEQTESLYRARSIDDYRAQAFALLTAPSARHVFDLSQERPATLDRYGRTRFGQSCLLARRLVESGVPFVQVNWSDHVEAEEDYGDGGWDMHYRNFEVIQERHLWMLDQTLSALLEDLHQRGMLQETLVVAMGEFGRTPKINDK